MNDSPKRHIIIGTAGHVDHGKTALIQALTGRNTDRLKEEKARGISIDLGFAPFRLPDGTVAGVVDVPGHERFINNMLTGVGGMDLVLLVVDVMEGVMPQTHEHLQILQLLNIQRGIVVLTKIDLAEPDWVDLVEEEIREAVAGTFLEEASICRVSSMTGDGIPELLETIRGAVETLVPKDADGPLRLPIDRDFSVSGFGTVVTGTILSGRVREGDTVEVLPPGKQVRVREVQVFGNKVPEASAGQRTALNLVGLDRNLIRRGSVVGTSGIFEQTSRMDIRLNLLPEAPRPIKFRDPVHFHLGTARVVGVVALLDRDELKPGESAIVQIHLDRPLVAHRQDRFIIRSYSPVTTIGGGVVIDPNPAKHRRFRKEIMETLAELESGEVSFLLQKISEAGPVRVRELETITGMGSERIAGHLKILQTENKAVLLGDQWVTAETARAWRVLMTEKTSDFHTANPLLPGIPRATLQSHLPKKFSPKGFDHLLSEALDEGDLVRREEWLHLPNFSPTPAPAQAREIERIESAYRRAGSQAENKREMLDQLGMEVEKTEDFLGYLFATERLVRLNDETFFHAETYRRALDLLREHFSRHDTLTLAEFRDLLGSSRKQVQALLEHFDGLKYTMRRGDERVAWKLPGKTSNLEH